MNPCALLLEKSVCECYVKVLNNMVCLKMYNQELHFYSPMPFMYLKKNNLESDINTQTHTYKHMGFMHLMHIILWCMNALFSYPVVCKCLSGGAHTATARGFMQHPLSVPCEPRARIVITYKRHLVHHFSKVGLKNTCEPSFFATYCKPCKTVSCETS